MEQMLRIIMRRKCFVEMVWADWELGRGLFCFVQRHFLFRSSEIASGFRKFVNPLENCNRFLIAIRVERPVIYIEKERIA